MSDAYTVSSSDKRLLVGDKLVHGIYPVPTSGRQESWNKANWDLDLRGVSMGGIADESPFFVRFVPDLATAGKALKDVMDITVKGTRMNILEVLTHDYVASVGRTDVGDQVRRLVAHKGDLIVKKKWRKFDEPVRIVGSKTFDMRMHDRSRTPYIKRIDHAIKRLEAVGNNYFEINVGLLDVDATHDPTFGGSETTMGAVMFSCISKGFDPLFPIRAPEFKQKIARKMGKIILAEVNRATEFGIKPRIEANLRSLARQIRNYVRSYIKGGIKPFLDDKTLRNRRWKSQYDGKLYGPGIDEALYESGQLCEAMDFDVVSERRRTALCDYYDQMRQVRDRWEKREKFIERYARRINSLNKAAASRASLQKSAEERAKFYREAPDDVFNDYIDAYMNWKIGQERKLQNEELRQFPELKEFTKEQRMMAQVTYARHYKGLRRLLQWRGAEGLKGIDPAKMQAIKISAKILSIRGVIDKSGSFTGRFMEWGG